MATITGFNGNQYPRSSNPIQQQAYNNNNVQYATSSYQIDHDMFPALICQPKDDKDVIAAVKYAQANNIAVAVKSGGHQYSGASSTSGKNMQIDLQNTYKDPTKDLVVISVPLPPHEGMKLVYASVSWSLGEFNKFLRANQLFVPHGQCTDVRIGGHAQTGGYGQLGRSFGLLGDHIRIIRLVDHDAVIRDITKESDPELFYAILGGSPGNLGVITHYTIEVHQDKAVDFPSPSGPHGYKGPHGIKGIWLYREDVLKKLLTMVATMADSPDFPRNFDLCVSILSSDFDITDLIPELGEGDMLDSMWDKINKVMPSKFLQHLAGKWPPSIILYAQWCPITDKDQYDDEVDAWFQQFRDLSGLLDHWALFVKDISEPMSKMTGEWLFTNPREFDHPYVKRTYLTKSTTLVQDGWIDTVADRIDMIMNPLRKHSDWDLWLNCWLSCQIQCFGGKLSQFTANTDNGTSYSWRDSTMVMTLDCFHESNALEIAQKWQVENDKLMIGEHSSYSKQDRRVLWASYGDWDLARTWPCYYEDEAKYKRLGEVRARVDPKGTFTPNPFAVESITK